MGSRLISKSETWKFIPPPSFELEKDADDSGKSTVHGMGPHSSYSRAMFQMKELWAVAHRSYLVRFDCLEISRLGLVEHARLHNLLVAMCLGDVPMCYCWHNSDVVVMRERQRQRHPLQMLPQLSPHFMVWDKLLHWTSNLLLAETAGQWAGDVLGWPVSSIFHGCRRSKLKLSCVSRKHFKDWAIFLYPRAAISCLKLSPFTSLPEFFDDYHCNDYQGLCLGNCQKHHAPCDIPSSAFSCGSQTGS